MTELAPDQALAAAETPAAAGASAAPTPVVIVRDVTPATRPLDPRTVDFAIYCLLIVGCYLLFTRLADARARARG